MEKNTLEPSGMGKNLFMDWKPGGNTSRSLSLDNGPRLLTDAFVDPPS